MGQRLRTFFVCLLILFCFVCGFLFLAALGLHWDVRLSLNIMLGASLVTVHTDSLVALQHVRSWFFWPRIKPTSLALEGRFSNTGSLGKSQAFLKVLYDRCLWSTGFYAVKPKYYMHSIHLGLHLPESHRTTETWATGWPAMLWVTVFVSDPGVLCLLHETMAGRLFLSFRLNTIIMTLCFFTAL